EGAAAAQGAVGPDVGGGAGDGAVHHGHAADHLERAAVEPAAAVDSQHAGSDPHVRGGAGNGAVHHGLAAGHVQRAVVEAAVEQQGAAFDAHVGGEVVVAVELEDARGDGGAAEAVVTGQAQPAGAGLGQPARAADVVGPVIPCAAFPGLDATGGGVHHHLGVHAQLAVAFDRLAQVQQAPTIDLVHAGRAQVGGGGQHDVAYLGGGEVREALQQQAQGAGHVRGGHGGAGVLGVPLDPDAVLELEAQVAVGVDQPVAGQRVPFVAHVRPFGHHGRKDLAARGRDAPLGGDAALH